ncbi:MAG: mandelate racemase/muconate lactonizing enzyme family protein [Planctomycetes bacterium]|nr:mandelate racemase/muconate lactonizing enzyme family protein [Planctomycetota bacterium]
MKIDRVEVLAVAPEVQRFTWSHDLPEQYMTNTLVRIYTDEGVEGVGGVSNYTSYGFDRYTTETLRHMIPVLIGKDPLHREPIWNALWSRVFPLSPGALAAIDIALWDLFGKYANLPVYQLLGGACDRIRSYASTPLFDDVATYLKFVEEMIEQGFHAIKFHCWCLPEKDRELVRAVRQAFPNRDVAFMLDVENNYEWQDALEMAQELEDLGFEWFEAPLMDYDREGYRKLTRRVNVPIIPSGNWIQDLSAWGHALRTDCWSRARTDVTVCGGFTPAQKYMALVKAAGMKCEIMSWGNTLVSSANLHLMLGSGLSSYYEQPVPYGPYEFGMHETIRTGSDGFVNAPQGPGLGHRIDWDAMRAATIHELDSREIA